MELIVNSDGDFELMDGKIIIECWNDQDFDLKLVNSMIKVAYRRGLSKVENPTKSSPQRLPEQARIPKQLEFDFEPEEYRKRLDGFAKLVIMGAAANPNSGCNSPKDLAHYSFDVAHSMMLESDRRVAVFKKMKEGVK